MAEGGSDYEISDMFVEDSDRDETLDPSRFAVPVCNSFDMRPDTRPGWGDDWQTVNRQTKKRKKYSSGSIDSNSFMELPNEEKLVCLFDSLNRNYDKLSSIEQIQKHCVTETNALNKGLNTTNKRVYSFEKDVDMYAQKLRMLSYRSLDIESRSRRNNIVFWGITERLPYDCNQLIQNFMRDELFTDNPDFDPKEMCIERAHRLGSLRSETYKNKTDPKRPIIVRFRDYNDTELIMKQAYRLRGSVFKIDRDYPKEIAYARKELYFSKEAFEGRRKQQRVQIKFPAKLFVDGYFIEDKFPEWYKILSQSRVEGFESDKTNNDLGSTEMRLPRESRPINPTHGQGHNQLSDRDASAQRDRSKSSWMSNSAWNDRLSEDRSVGKTVDSRASPVASQLSPSLLDSSEQNVNTGKSTSHVSRVRSHSNDSRASAKNNQSKYHQPEFSKSQTEQQRIFKSPARVARSRNKSNNINSRNNTPQNKKETAGRSMPTSEPNRLSLSQSVERMRVDRSKSKNRASKKPDPNIDLTESQPEPGQSGCKQ